MPYYYNNNVHLYYEYEAALEAPYDAETVILIHGLAFDLRTWDRMVPFMGKYHILRYDYRGHGLSTNGEDPYTDTAFVHDLHSIMKSLHITKAHFVGHGAGAVIALYYAKYYPSNVLSTILLSIPLFLTEETVIKYTSYRKSFLTLQDLANHVLPHVTLFQADTAEMNKLYTSYMNTTIDAYLEMLEFFLHNHQQIKEMFIAHDRPLLFLSGEQDAMYPAYLSSLIATVNPICRFVTIYNASNMVFYDQPEDTFSHIEKFWMTSEHRTKKLSTDPLILDLHADFFNLMENERAKNEPVLSVELIDKFEIHINTIPIANGWGRRNARKLLIYLVFNPSVTRDQLCSDLFGELDLTKARSQLRVCLIHLKQQLHNNENHFLQIDNKQITLKGIVQCDLLSVLDKLKNTVDEPDLQTKEQLVKQLFNDIKPTLFANLIDEWSLHIRTKAEIQLVSLAIEQSVVFINQGKLMDAIAYLKYTLMFNEDEPAIIYQIADLYEQSQYYVEAQKWRELAEDFLSIP